MGFLYGVLQHLTEFLSGRIRAKPNKGLSLFGYVGVATGDVHARVRINFVHSCVLEIVRINVAQQSGGDNRLPLFSFVQTSNCGVTNMPVMVVSLPLAKRPVF
jgi:hypothetical protein